MKTTLKVGSKVNFLVGHVSRKYGCKYGIIKEVIDIYWIMDYETLSNCFVGIFKHYKTNIYKKEINCKKYYSYIKKFI